MDTDTDAHTNTHTQTRILLHRDTRDIQVPFSKISTEGREWVFNEPDCIVCQAHNCGTPEYQKARNYMRQRDALQYNSESGDLFFIHNSNRDTFSGVLSYAYQVTGSPPTANSNFSITREVYLNVPRFYELYKTITSIPYDVICLFGDFNNCTMPDERDILQAVKYSESDFRCDIPVPFALFTYQHENIRWMLSAENSGTTVSPHPRILRIPPPPGLPPTDAVYVSTEHKRVYTHEAYTRFFSDTVRFPGGGLFDDVGLGKTACVILLSVMNPVKSRKELYAKYTAELYGPDSTVYGVCQKLLKTQVPCGGIVSNNTQVFCHRHIPRGLDTSEFTATTSDFVVKKKSPFGNYPVHLLQSKATIIFVPNQVTTQWEEAIHTIPWVTEQGKRNNLIVITLTTKTQFDTVTYLQLLTADFVIVSHNFLTNDTFIQSVRRYTSNDTFDFKEALLNVSYNNVYSDPHFLYTVSPFIGCIRWHRMVIDEVHEIPDSDFLCRLYSKYRWCLSGTPVSARVVVKEKLPTIVRSSAYRRRTELFDFVDPFNTTTIQALNPPQPPQPLNLLLNPPPPQTPQQTNLHSIHSIEYILKYVAGPQFTYKPSEELDSYIANNVIRRNTDLSTAHEKQIPPITEYTYLLPLSHIERGLYDGYAKDNRFTPSMLEYPSNAKPRYKNSGTVIERLRELCSHPYMHAGFESAESLEDVSALLIGNYNARIQELETLIHTKTASCDKLLADVSQVSSDGDVMEYLQERVTALLKEISKAEADLKAARMNLNYYSTSCKAALESPDTECSICFAPFISSVVGIANCGHSFCYECIMTISKKAGGGPCALCRAKIHTVTRIDNTIPKQTSVYPVPPEYTRLQNKYGTKIAHVIMCIKYTIQQGERVIIFSQWTRLLKKMEDILCAEGIKCVSCRGNVSGKNNALRVFQNNPAIPVICLSSNNAASGSNLMCASVIVFLESLFDESREKCIEMEEQANGRARRLGQKLPVKVYRFITKDTIELNLLDMYSPNSLTSNVVDCSKEMPVYLGSTVSQL